MLTMQNQTCEAYDFSSTHSLPIRGPQTPYFAEQAAALGAGLGLGISVAPGGHLAAALQNAQRQVVLCVRSGGFSTSRAGEPLSLFDLTPFAGGRRAVCRVKESRP